MTLIIQKPTGAKLNLAQTYVGTDDPDAAAYITAVETADGQSLETAVKVAIHSFVKGCKVDGIWPAIKASCILAGARTLAGALVPLVGTAPTNINFVAGDYDRETGLKGNGGTKYLTSNRAGNADPLNNRHISVYVGQLADSSTTYWAATGDSSGALAIGASTTQFFAGVSCGTQLVSGLTPGAGFFGASRLAAASFSARGGGVNGTSSTASTTPQQSNDVRIFGRLTNDGTQNRFAFYSIGESLSLAQLDSRVTTLINAIGAAIP